LSPAGWAVITGQISGIVTLDFDGEAGRDLILQLNLRPHRRTGSGGFHVDVVHPGWHVPTYNVKSNRSMGHRWRGLDVRGDGGYAVFLGRNHSGAYMWLHDSPPVAASALSIDLRRVTGLLCAPSAEHARRTFHCSRAGVSVSPDYLLRRALSCAAADGRNNAGFWLACQLRDNGFSVGHACCVMEAFAERVPRTNRAGKRAPYTKSEAAASLRQAFVHPPRDPWHGRARKPHVS
jgi:hypothetical protein